MNVKTNWKLPIADKYVWEEIRIFNWICLRNRVSGERKWTFRPSLQKRVVLDKPLPQTEEK